MSKRYPWLPEFIAVPLRRSRHLPGIIARFWRWPGRIRVGIRNVKLQRQRLAMMERDASIATARIASQAEKLAFLRARLWEAEKAAAKYPGALVAIRWVIGNDNAHCGATWYPNSIARPVDWLERELAGDNPVDRETMRRAMQIDPAAFSDDGKLPSSPLARQRAAIRHASN